MVYSEKEWNSKHSVTPFYSNVMREGKLLWVTLSQTII
jgi:hypothetical protein